MKSILVTGCNGMLGSYVVKSLLDANYYVVGVSKESGSHLQHTNFKYIPIDLTNPLAIEALFRNYAFTNVIHLAAIAHVIKGINISWSNYYRVNTIASRNLFDCAKTANVPVFFASTFDVYGIKSEVVYENSTPNPVGAYAKSKFLAERELIDCMQEKPFLIARFAPIYSKNNRKDIHKRYYLSYPKIAYLIGNGMSYHFLSVENAVSLILRWVEHWKVLSGIINVCDKQPYNTKVLIANDKHRGMAQYVIRIPMWLKDFAKKTIDLCFAKHPFLRLNAYKVINPLQVNSDCFQKAMNNTDNLMDCSGGR